MDSGFQYDFFSIAAQPGQFEISATGAVTHGRNLYFGGAESDALFEVDVEVYGTCRGGCLIFDGGLECRECFPESLPGAVLPHFRCGGVFAPCDDAVFRCRGCFTLFAAIHAP